jgi:hypothetical protein
VEDPAAEPRTRAANRVPKPASSAQSAVDLGGMDGLIAAAKKDGTLNLIAVPPTWAGYGPMVTAVSTKYDIKINSEHPDGSGGDEINAIKSPNGHARSGGNTVDGRLGRRAPVGQDGEVRRPGIALRAAVHAIRRRVHLRDESAVWHGGIGRSVASGPAVLLPFGGSSRPAGSTVDVLVRPESVVVSKDDHGDSMVVAATFRGASTRLRCARSRTLPRPLRRPPNIPRLSQPQHRPDQPSLAGFDPPATEINHRRTGHPAPREVRVSLVHWSSQAALLGDLGLALPYATSSGSSPAPVGTSPTPASARTHPTSAEAISRSASRSADGAAHKDSSAASNAQSLSSESTSAILMPPNGRPRVLAWRRTTNCPLL